MCLKVLLNSPLTITNPRLLTHTGYSTKFISGMVSDGPLGGGPPHCHDWIKTNHAVSSYYCYKGSVDQFHCFNLQKCMIHKVLKINNLTN